MPKVVNRVAVREAIAHAVWRVLQEDGSKNLSVRTIAQAAALPASTLRHYFPSQSELLLFSMRLVAERVQERIEMTLKTQTTASLRPVLLQFLPLDAARRLEMEVWLYFISEAKHSPSAARLRTQLQQEVHALLRRLLLAEKSKLTTEQADNQALHLQALVDGLTLQYLAVPTVESRRRIVALLDQHLDRLFTNSRGDSEWH